MQFCGFSRNPRPRRRRFNHLRRAPGGQDVRSSFGNNPEHEQSRGLALQQSQEADIGEETSRTGVQEKKNLDS